MKILPSLISSDLLKLQETLHAFDADVAGYHIDIMDNHFVPNLTWGPMFVTALQRGTLRPLHLHLMVTDPFAWIKKLTARPGDCFIFHIEAVFLDSDIEGAIQNIRQAGFMVGIALNPKTEIEKLFPFLKLIDVLLVMAVEPGFSGQVFLPEIFVKLKALVEHRKLQTESWALVVDGGVNEHNISELARIGVDMVTPAAAIFFAPDPMIALRQLRQKSC